jgi:hypothetical protein
MSETPSVASPLKIGQQQSLGQIRRDRPQGSMRRLITREEETIRECEREDTRRLRTGRRGAAVARQSLGAEAAGGSGITQLEGGMGTDEETTMTGATTRARRKTRKTRGRMNYM